MTPFETLYVESGEAAESRLRERGLTPTPPEEAARLADILILSIPDKLIGKVSGQVVPLMKPRRHADAARPGRAARR